MLNCPIGREASSAMTNTLETAASGCYQTLGSKSLRADTRSDKTTLLRKTNSHLVVIRDGSTRDRASGEDVARKGMLEAEKPGWRWCPNDSSAKPNATETYFHFEGRL